MNQAFGVQNVNQQNPAGQNVNQQMYGSQNGYQQAPGYQQGPVNPQGYPNMQQGAGYYQPQPKKKGGSGVIIAIVVVILLLLLSIGAFIAIKIKSAVDTIGGTAQAMAEGIVEAYTDGNGAFDSDKAFENQGQTLKSLTSKGIDMTGKTMYATHDGVTREEDSYWEFTNDQKAMLVFGEGEYFEADYKVLEGTLGMLYTDFEFPEYGLTYDELFMVTKARTDSDDSCNGYVMIEFDNLMEHKADGSTESVGSGRVLYYGVSYDKGDSTYYDIVGANSASYYNFLCDK